MGNASAILPGTYSAVVVASAAGDTAAETASQLVVPVETPIVDRLRVRGPARVGARLRCVGGAVTGWEPPQRRVRWLAGRKAIRGARTASFRVPRALRGKAIRCQVLATNSGGTKVRASWPVTIRR